MLWQLGTMAVALRMQRRHRINVLLGCAATCYRTDLNARTAIDSGTAQESAEVNGTDYTLRNT
jgi:hypothetical protein